MKGKTNMPPNGNKNRWAKNPIPEGDESLTDTSRIDSEIEYPGVGAINHEKCTASHGFHIAFRVKYVTPDLLQNGRYVDQVCRRLLEFMVNNFPYAIYRRLTELIISRNQIFIERERNEKAIGSITDLHVFDTDRSGGYFPNSSDSCSVGRETALASGEN